MGWPIVAAAGVTALSSALGAAYQSKQARKAAQRQMDFQERMASTRYQRTMADMRAAGLNPILAYQQGGGSIPGGSTYSPPNIGAEAAKAGASVYSAGAAGEQATTAKSLMHSTRKLQDSQAKLNKELGGKANEEANLANNLSAKAFHDTMVSYEEIKNRRTHGQILRENYQSALAAAAADRESERFYNTELGRRMRQIDIIGRSLNPFASSARQIYGR